VVLHFGGPENPYSRTRDQFRFSRIWKDMKLPFWPEEEALPAQAGS
jgi:hypothetical protein